MAYSYAYVEPVADPGARYGEEARVQKRLRELPDGRSSSLQSFVWQNSTIVNCAVQYSLFDERISSSVGAAADDTVPFTKSASGGDPYPTILKSDLVFTKSHIEFMPEPGKSGLIVWSRFDHAKYADMKDVVFVGIADTEAYFGPNEAAVEEIPVAVEGVRTIVNETGHHLNHGDRVFVELPRFEEGDVNPHKRLEMFALKPSGEEVGAGVDGPRDRIYTHQIGVVLNADVAPGDNIMLLMRKSQPVAHVAAGAGAPAGGVFIGNDDIARRLWDMLTHDADGYPAALAMAMVTYAERQIGRDGVIGDPARWIDMLNLLQRRLDERIAVRRAELEQIARRRVMMRMPPPEPRVEERAMVAVRER